MARGNLDDALRWMRGTGRTAPQHASPERSALPDGSRRRPPTAQSHGRLHHAPMRTVIVTDHEQEWFQTPDAAVLTARGYLAEAENGRDGSVRVLNLCRTGRYQGRGYYVSLLAEARGQRPLPDVKTVEDLKSEAYVQALAAKLAPLVEETLHHQESDRFELSVYLGKDPAQLHQALAEKLFASVRAPLLRALFRLEGTGWRLEAVQAIGLADVPVQHRAFLVEAARA